MSFAARSGSTVLARQWFEKRSNSSTSTRSERASEIFQDGMVGDQGGTIQAPESG